MLIIEEPYQRIDFAALFKRFLVRIFQLIVASRQYQAKEF